MLHIQDPSIITVKVILHYASHPGSQHHYCQGYPSLCFTSRILASLLSRLSFTMLHIQDPSIITVKVVLPYASHPGSQHHYCQGYPSLCFTSRIPASLLSRLSFTMLHILDPSIITVKVILHYDSHPGSQHHY